MFVYKITNIINKKVYIGQTKTSLKRRFKQHLKQTVCKKLSNAIKKYGSENFTIECIEEVNCPKLLDEREEYWIKYYNSVKNGYNILESKKGFKLTKKQIKSYKENFKKRQHTPVIIKHVETNVEICFISIGECARFLNCNRTRIYEALRKSTRKYKKYLFRFANEDFKEPEQLRYPQERCVIGIDVKNYKIYLYSKLKNCNLDNFVADCVSNACKGKRNHTYKKIKWFYLTEFLLNYDLSKIRYPILTDGE